MSADAEIQHGQRFAFGENWRRFLDVIGEGRIADAEASLHASLDLTSYGGKTFLDAGSGSGLFSLAAHRLGMKVVSFDFDPASVACTEELKRRYAPDSGADWMISHGSVLDEPFLASLGTFDIVYSWGVLHHTGDMWSAAGAVAACVADGGRLYIALYNDQGLASDVWRRVKRAYNRAGPRRKALIEGVTGAYFGFRRAVGRGIRKLSGGAATMDVGRGMEAKYDLRDWVGGYPFEVARPDEVFHFFKQRGFVLEAMTTMAGHLGCNEFVFRRRACPAGNA